jgi:hypothetical protein
VFRFVFFGVLFSSLALGQEDHSHMQMGDSNAAGGDLMGLASGTSENPESGSLPMLMQSRLGWDLMWMAQAFIADTQETGARGTDKFFSTNWGMFNAAHALAGGTFEFDLMLSLEPATVTDRRYPELFQTGESAYGKPLVDAQHPHNFIMGLGVHYAHPLSRSSILELYFAPVGDPALGPVAFPHRASAAELPEAPLSHHWQDSTHIAYDVVTAGIKYDKFRLEASGFYGTEPGENRWIVEHGPINSWSTRLSYYPARNWSAQVSAGRLTNPEADQPGDVIRTTASVEYTRPMQGSAWATSLIWGRNHDTFTRRDLNSYLLESVTPWRRKNFFTGRIERVDKDELFVDQPDLEAQLARTAGSTFRIGAYTAGYTRDIGTFENIETGIGANFSTYSMPDAIKAYYGDHPFAVDVYLRLRLKPER